MRPYGKFSAEGFAGAISLFTQEFIACEEDIRHWANWFKETDRYEIFKEAFHEFLLDDSISFAEKTALYCEEDFPSGQAWDYWKWIWENYAPDEPWPLEGQQRPEDEPEPKRYEFKG